MIELNKDEKYLLLLEGEDGQGIIMKLHSCKFDDEDDDSFYNDYLDSRGYFYDDNDGYYFLDAEKNGMPKLFAPDGHIKILKVGKKYKIKGITGIFELQDNEDSIRLAIPPFQYYFKQFAEKKSA